MQWIKVVTPLVSIVAILVLEIIAICHGINGTTLSIALCSIGGLGGYGVKELVPTIKKFIKKEGMNP